jgi:hypothetical protein
MSSNKRMCVECKQKRKCIPFLEEVNGTIRYVCKLCWEALDYSPYFKETAELAYRTWYE